MRIEKNKTGYGRATPAGIGYIVHGAPAVADIGAGAVWLFTCDVNDPDGEDTLTLLDLNDDQAAMFDDDGAAYVASVGFSIPKDWSQTSIDAPRNLFERAGIVFETIQADVWEEFREEAGAPSLSEATR
jgi:hypothetical protein